MKLPSEAPKELSRPQLQAQDDKKCFFWSFPQISDNSVFLKLE
jgi:hypothetical protein